MNGVGSDFYSVSQAARALHLTPERVLQLINEGDLKAHRAGQPGDWLIEAHSILARLKKYPPQPQQLPEVVSKTTTASSLSKGTPEESRILDSLVLVTIGLITLLAALYTLLPELFGQQKSTQLEENTASAAPESTQQKTATAPTAAPEKTNAATLAPAGWTSAIGDSVMLGAIGPLEQKIPNLALIDAQGSRQAPSVIDILRKRGGASQLGDVAVIHIGNNGPLTNEQFDEMMRALAGVRKVLIVNLSVPPSVKDPVAVPNNAVLADGVRRHPNAMLVDWRAASANHPEFFAEDGIHLTLEGAQAYAELIAANFAEEDAEGSVALPGPQERISWGEGGSFGECVGPSSWCSVPVTP